MLKSTNTPPPQKKSPETVKNINTNIGDLVLCVEDYSMVDGLGAPADGQCMVVSSYTYTYIQPVNDQATQVCLQAVNLQLGMHVHRPYPYN